MSSPTFKVAKFEILRQLKKPAFWAATLLLPLFIVGIYLISFLSSQSVNETPEIKEEAKIAIIDKAGIFSKNIPYLIEGEKETGIEKIKNGEVDLFYYIPKDFVDTKKAEFYHISEGLDIFNFDGNILKTLLTQDAASRVGELDTIALTGKYEIVDNKLTKNGENSNALGKAIIPFAIGIMFFMLVALCGNRFLLTVVEEKENRISEMILTSISAKHLIVGKIISMLTLGLIQILVIFIPVILIAVFGKGNQTIGPIINMIEFDPLMITLSIILFIVASIFYAGTCTFVGSLTATAKDASSFIGPAIIAMVFPLYFMQMFMMPDPSFIVQFLTYFPLSAPVALILRSGFGTISTPEYCIGIAVVAISAVIMIYLAIKTFQKNAINFSNVKLSFGKKS